MALLDKHVKKEWPEAGLFLYGSCANSFGFRKSDIDVCLAMGDADIDKAEILLKLADILKSDHLENVQVNLPFCPYLIHPLLVHSQETLNSKSKVKLNKNDHFFHPWETLNCKNDGFALVSVGVDSS